MTRRSLLLSLKPHRFVLVGSALACLGAASLAAAVAVWLASYPAPAGCIDPAVRFTPGCAGYAEALMISQGWAAKVMAVLAVLPFLVGLVLGVPLVAAEIENRTATLAWWLEPSRRRWLLLRVAVVGIVLSVLLALPAMGGDLLERARVPRFDPTTTVFLDQGARGGLLVARGIAAYAIGLLVGLIIGRVLPALVVAGLVTAVLLVLLGEGRWAALPAPEPIASAPDRYVLIVAGGGPSMYADRTGKLYSPAEIEATAPAAIGTSEFYSWYEAHGFTQVTYGIDGQRLWVVGARELAGLTAGTIVLVGLSIRLIGVRRPY